MKNDPNPSLAALLALLDLRPAGPNRFTGPAPEGGGGRLFGGQVLAQALTAAARTVPADRLCHSLHAYFLRPGDAARPTHFQVDPSRDGGSFSARRVVAIQNDAPEGRPIFTLAASFQKVEGGFDHQDAMPDVPGPDELEDEQAVRLADPGLDPSLRAFIARNRPFETRPVRLMPLGEGAPRPPLHQVWVRARGALPDHPGLHRALLAFASDMSLLGTSLLPHGKSIFSNLAVASIDHAMWFHRPFRADDWLLFVQDSPSASGGRGFNRGSVFARDGRLVASVAQEGLIRPRSSG